MRTLLIHNPHSGQRDRRQEVAASANRLRDAGWQVEQYTSTSPQELEEATRAAVESGAEVVIAAGGDGTLNAAIQALAHRGVPLGVLPTGTANVWAREMGIPLDVQAATDVLLSGTTLRTDLGQANGRYFLFVTGIGFDASVARGLHLATKRRLGMLAYPIAAIAEALKLRGTEVTITTDEGVSHERILMMVASNIRLYGGVLTIAPEAFADDGLLDVWVFRGRGLPAALIHAINVLLRRHPRDHGTRFYRCSRLSVTAKSALPVQLDGDYLGTTPVTLQVAPRALQVIVPPGPHQLFLQVPVRPM